jgi:hypothetical protein
MTLPPEATTQGLNGSALKPELADRVPVHARAEKFLLAVSAELLDGRCSVRPGGSESLTAVIEKEEH